MTLMFQIAGGIILAVLFFAALPYLVSGIVWVLDWDARQPTRQPTPRPTEVRQSRTAWFLLAVAVLGAIAFAVWLTLATWPTNQVGVIECWVIITAFIGFIAYGHKERPPSGRHR